MPSNYRIAAYEEILPEIWIIAFLFISFTACKHTSSYELDNIAGLLDNKLDSALYLLRKINMVNLSEKDQAEYALFYTTAQDKSGLDVDNDSLIRLAYMVCETSRGFSLCKMFVLYGQVLYAQ